jgi:hypothetical protein
MMNSKKRMLFAEDDDNLGTLVSHLSQCQKLRIRFVCKWQNRTGKIQSTDSMIL